MFENKNKVCVGGVVLADSMKVFSFLKIKLTPPHFCLSISMTKYLLIHSAKYMSFIHCHCFYYHRESLFVDAVLIKGQEILPFLKLRPCSMSK